MAIFSVMKFHSSIHSQLLYLNNYFHWICVQYDFPVEESIASFRFPIGLAEMIKQEKLLFLLLGVLL